MILYRPVGTKELKLIEKSNFCEFPPRLPDRQGGGSQHKELWIPAEKLKEFNEHIIGKICVISKFSDD